MRTPLPWGPMPPGWVPVQPCACRQPGERTVARAALGSIARFRPRNGCGNRTLLCSSPGGAVVGGIVRARGRGAREAVGSADPRLRACTRERFCIFAYLNVLQTPTSSRACTRVLEEAAVSTPRERSARTRPEAVNFFWIWEISTFQEFCYRMYSGFTVFCLQISVSVGIPVCRSLHGRFAICVCFGE